MVTVKPKVTMGNTTKHNSQSHCSGHDETADIQTKLFSKILPSNTRSHIARYG